MSTKGMPCSPDLCFAGARREWSDTEGERVTRAKRALSLVFPGDTCPVLRFRHVTLGGNDPAGGRYRAIPLAPLEAQKTE